MSIWQIIHLPVHRFQYILGIRSAASPNVPRLDLFHLLFFSPCPLPRSVGLMRGKGSKKKYPLIKPSYEAKATRGLFVLGTASHSVDFRKAAGGFIHGFRYTGEPGNGRNGLWVGKKGRQKTNDSATVLLGLFCLPFFII